MKILISTDTSCVVKKDSLQKYDISLFPLNVIVDGEEFLDGITINQDKLKDDMRAGKSIKTSTPPLGEVIDYFEGLFNKGYDYVIHFTISSKLSSMNQLFHNVAEQNFAGKVTVVDSYSLSSVMLAQVLYAYEETKKGTEIDKILERIEEIKKQSSIFFIPENLTALKNGGRISPAIALIGNTIGIKPVIALKDGELQKESMTRKVRGTFNEKLEVLSQTCPPADYDYTVINFDGKPELVDYLLKYVQSVVGESSTLLGTLPVNVCAHCGPGTVGLIATPKINGKSLNEFI